MKTTSFRRGFYSLFYQLVYVLIIMLKTFQFNPLHVIGTEFIKLFLTSTIQLLIISFMSEFFLYCFKFEIGITLSLIGSLTVISNFPLTKSLKTLIISMLLSFFIVKFVKINVLIWANVCYNRHRR